MKAASFVYHAPRTSIELTQLLSSLDNVRMLAGGQSLMPMLNLRVAAPDHLVDLNRVEGLGGIELRGDKLVIGAMTRQREAELSPLVAEHCPLLIQALGYVGFQQTRNRGTVGGSIAHMDPTAELIVAAYVLDATVVLKSRDGERSMSVREFNDGYLCNKAKRGEFLARVEFPIRSERHGVAFEEVTRRGETLAVVSVGVLVELGREGELTRASAAVGGLRPAPVCLDAAPWLGRAPQASMAEDLARRAGELIADDDLTIPAEYKQHVAGVLTRRAVGRALARVQEMRDD
ncbi:xanthine dehydrogenase family protein subunit M [Pusillimonas caeni]|uniref:FAD binding domain-containing protein n=1 Tax=Pusillimonas caeni TaxID=1348472 RepID=UPI000E59B7E3|nr:FAD binding domain-containing protein [Pusillimonas caeni]TFL13199.1 xanthine dehydrogenase family protein subunit M [Pusillimonas caeni]